MKIIVLAVSMLVIACSTPPQIDTATAPAERVVANSPLYHRLYQGYLVDRKTPQADFEKNINESFLPLFVQAHAVGLVAYRPALPKNLMGCELPNEIALLSFESKDVYDNLYSKAPIREQIVAAHSIFDGKISKSLVPETYAGAIKEGVAYTLDPAFSNITAAHSIAVIHCGLKGKKEPAIAALERAYALATAAKNIMFTLSANHIVEYVFFETPEEKAQFATERQKRLSGVFRRSSVIELKKHKIGEAPVSVGQGLDAQWE